MKLKNFENNDLNNAISLSHLVWGDFYRNENIELQNLIYEFTIKYYDLNRSFSYSIFDTNGIFKGFVFAFRKNDKNDSFDILKNILSTLNNQSHKTRLSELYEYLHYCGQETKKFMSDDDIMLGLFVSIQKGCGKLLLSQLVNKCAENKINNIYLWSDSACDYDYYQKHNFELLKEIKTSLNFQDITVFVYKKAI